MLRLMFFLFYFLGCWGLFFDFAIPITIAKGKVNQFMISSIIICRIGETRVGGISVEGRVVFWLLGEMLQY